MHSETIAVLGVVLLTFVAGCGGIAEETSTPSPKPTEISSTTTTPEPAGFVSVKVVETAPDNATVISINNSSLTGIEPVQTLVRSDRENVAHQLPKSELERVLREMPDMYRYGGDQFGWYITHQNELHWVRIIRYV